MLKAKRKLLSQNFLYNRALVQNLVRGSSIGKNDTVLEIGSGQGIITEQLLQQAKSVISLEIDKDLFTDLKKNLSSYKNLTLLNQDFAKSQLPTGEYKVFSNLPFRFTFEFVNRLLRSDNPPIDSYIILQEEAANKFLGGSLLSALYYPNYIFSIVHKFHAYDFAPMPSVNVVLLRITKREKPLLAKNKFSQFADFMSYIFSQKKPYVWKSNTNVSKVRVDDWVEIFGDFTVRSTDAQKRLINGWYEKLLNEQGKLSKIHRTRIRRGWRKFIKR